MLDELKYTRACIPYKPIILAIQIVRGYSMKNVENCLDRELKYTQLEGVRVCNILFILKFEKKFNK